MDDQDILWDRLIQQSEEEMLHDDRAGVADCAAQSTIPAETIVRDADARDINAFIDAIAQSHGCDVGDVIFYCDPAIGDDGNVKINEVLLIFSIRSLDHGKITDRVVHTMRIKTTQEVQQLARAMLDVQSACASASSKLPCGVKKAPVAVACAASAMAATAPIVRAQVLSDAPASALRTSEAPATALPTADARSEAPASAIRTSDAPATARAKRKRAPTSRAKRDAPSP